MEIKVALAKVLQNFTFAKSPGSEVCTYSKTCLKGSLKNRQNKGLKDN